MTEIRLTPDAAKAVVSGGTQLRTKSVQKVSRVLDSPTVPVESGNKVEIALLKSAWTQGTGTDYVWKATAYVTKDGIFDTSELMYIYAPTADSAPSGTVDTTRYFVVWRNNTWQVIAWATSQSALSVTKVDVLKSLSAPTSSFINTFTKTTASYLTSATTSKTTATQTVLSGVTVASGALVFTSDSVTYVSDVSTSTTSDSAVATASTTSSNAVTSVTSATENVVSKVEYAS